jgi:hypothetical protein
MESRETSLAGHEVWWIALRAALANAAPAVPKDLRGTIQFQIDVDDQEPIHRHLVLSGPQIVAVDGLAEKFHTFVRAKASDLVDFAKNDRLPEGTFRVAGDAQLYFRLVESASKLPASGSQVAIRSGAWNR